MIAKKWKQPKCPSNDKGTNKIQYNNTMDYYSAIKRAVLKPFKQTI